MKKIISPKGKNSHKESKLGIDEPIYKFLIYFLKLFSLKLVSF